MSQWNAGGRKRNLNEIYIPIPSEIHQLYPNFFPSKALSDWLLRKVLQLEEGELATIEKLDNLGFDSVIIMKKDSVNYTIDIMKTNSYELFSNT